MKMKEMRLATAKRLCTLALEDCDRDYWIATTSD